MSNRTWAIVVVLVVALGVGVWRLGAFRQLGPEE